MWSIIPESFHGMNPERGHQDSFSFATPTCGGVCECQDCSRDCFWTFNFDMSQCGNDRLICIPCGSVLRCVHTSLCCKWWSKFKVPTMDQKWNLMLLFIRGQDEIQLPVFFQQGCSIFLWNLQTGGLCHRSMQFVKQTRSETKLWSPTFCMWWRNAAGYWISM